MMSADVIATELEIALHQMLHRLRHRGPGHIEVSIEAQGGPPIYVVVLSSDAARPIRETLSALLGVRPNTDGMRWFFKLTDAMQIGRSANKLQRQLRWI